MTVMHSISFSSANVVYHIKASSFVCAPLPSVVVERLSSAYPVLMAIVIVHRLMRVVLAS
jgi:hypothetical protein